MLVVARLRGDSGAAASPGHLSGGSIDVVLRTGRVLRIRPDVAPEVLRRLVQTLEQ